MDYRRTTLVLAAAQRTVTNMQQRGISDVTVAAAYGLQSLLASTNISDAEQTWLESSEGYAAITNAVRAASA